jgi:predicted TIM-barrel fold metal-dependent hydrolase
MTSPFIIDVHTHLGVTPEFRPRFGSLADFIRLMDTTRTEISIFVPMGPLNGQFEAGYGGALEILDEYPDRLRAYTVFDPLWPDVSFRWIRKLQDHPGFVGVKIHPARHGVPPEDFRYGELWDFAEESRLVVLTHTWSPDPGKPVQNLSTPDRFAPVLERYPNVRLILGHAGGKDIGERQAVDLMKRYPNSWADLSGDNFSLGRFESMVAEAGADRYLYGTDSNWIDPRYLVGHVLKARISEEDRYRIMRLNAIEVFGERLGLKD